MSEKTYLKVAILWHMHQPFYFDPRKKQFLLPWARLHGLKDYLDMPLAATQYPGVKVTFNLVPSLLDQIDMYCQGYRDRHQELSGIPALELRPDEKKEILSTFFAGHPATMIEPYPRFRQLFRKKESSGNNLDLAIELFSTSEWRDIQMWSNLVWMDPRFRKEKEIAGFYDRGRDFTEEDKRILLSHQIEILKRIIPTYQQLYREGKIDVSFTPYYHPILPLLADTDSAKEALPNIQLPAERFRHPEDARWQIHNAAEKFRDLFGSELKGMWPSEGSVSEEVLGIIRDEGITWAATDEEVLYNSQLKTGGRRGSPHTAYEFSGAPGLKIFFRDKGLSDKIGFVYSTWEAGRAVGDFMQALHNIADFLKDNLKDKVVTVILDGENAWEYYPDDGSQFLDKFYQALATDERIKTVGLSEATQIGPAAPLKSIMAGSWINHNFRIWIGHNEDNAAWNLLAKAREALVNFQKSHPDADPDTIARAWRQIYIAEGSDWCWWYGDEHIGVNNAQFDELFRLHLKVLYEILGLAPPEILMRPIHRTKAEAILSFPEALLTPHLDGILTHYYEWSGAGHYDCLKGGGAMHRVDSVISDIFFAFDSEHFHIRLDFGTKLNLVDIKDSRVIIEFKSADRMELLLERGELIEKEGFKYILDRILEVSLERTAIIPKGFGTVEFAIHYYQGAQLLEKWPVEDYIAVDLPERDREIFWQV
ncbi:Amylopullulanase [Candidatus Zixiibacteriota bacterium]|nr:Amylopullulanase [candidate division Zixibacteria bacterium]